jgi:DNA polymerase (family 10)
MENREAARTLFGVAALLEAQGANPYRVRAYRRAARGLLRLEIRAGEYVNPEGECDLPWLGPRLRRKLGELVVRGRMQFHDELVEQLPPALRDLLEVPGIGPKTAQRLIDKLNVRSARGVARAARQGRLRTLPMIGDVLERKLGAAADAVVARRSGNTVITNVPARAA